MVATILDSPTLYPSSSLKNITEFQVFLGLEKI